MSTRAVPPPGASGRNLAAGRSGARDMLTLAAGVVPFGMVIGWTARAVGQGPVEAGGSALVVYGGSAHLSALTLSDAGASLLAVLGTVALVHARLLVYSAALEPRFRGQPSWFRWLGPQLIIDQTYVLVEDRLPRTAGPEAFRRYWLSAGLALGAVWSAAVVTGAALGPVLAEIRALEFAAVAVFVAALVPRLADQKARRIAATAAVTTAVTSTLPTSPGLVLGIVAGLAVAVVTERSRP